MNSLKLKEAMNEIHMGGEMRKEIMGNVKKRMERRGVRRKRMKKAAAAAASAALVFGAAVPAAAGIRYLVIDRLEQIPEEELEEVNGMIQAQEDVQADGFSRAYSREEEERMEQLEEAYQNGRFPGQTITLVDDGGQAMEDTLCYAVDCGMFYLPDRTLTDEELLEIIDFRYVTDYALAGGEEAQAAKEKQASGESRLKEKVQRSESLTEAEALMAAAEYLKTEFGVSAEGMEVLFFLDEEAYGIPVYHVRYDTKEDGAAVCYGIDVNAEDGRLMDTSHASLP